MQGARSVWVTPTSKSSGNNNSRDWVRPKATECIIYLLLRFSWDCLISILPFFLFFSIYAPAVLPHSAAGRIMPTATTTLATRWQRLNNSPRNLPATNIFGFFFSCFPSHHWTACLCNPAAHSLPLTYFPVTIETAQRRYYAYAFTHCFWGFFLCVCFCFDYYYYFLALYFILYFVSFVVYFAFRCVT